MIDVVYIVERNSIDWSGPPPTFAGIGRTVEEALRSVGISEDQIEAWINDREIRAYFSVRAYDMTTSPPQQMCRPDLQ